MIRKGELRKKLVNKFIEEEFQKIKSLVYKKLWDDTKPRKEIVFELPFDKKIIILNDEISFNEGKTYFHRSDEKDIINAFDNLQSYNVKRLLEELPNEEEELFRESENFNNNNNDISSDDLFNELIAVFDHLSNEQKGEIGIYITFALGLKSIVEQIELVKKMGGNEEKLLSLLEEKHELIKNFHNMQIKKMN